MLTNHFIHWDAEIIFGTLTQFPRGKLISHVPITHLKLHFQGKANTRK